MDKAQQVAVAHIKQLSQVSLSLCSIETMEMASCISQEGVFVLSRRVPAWSSVERGR